MVSPLEALSRLLGSKLIATGPFTLEAMLKHFLTQIDADSG